MKVLHFQNILQNILLLFSVSFATEPKAIALGNILWILNVMLSFSLVQHSPNNILGLCATL